MLIMLAMGGCGRQRAGALLAALLALVLGPETAAADEEPEVQDTLRVQATLVELPKTPPCEGKRLVRVVTHYRVEKVLRGSLEPGASSILVAHRCPEFARGPGRYGHGKAGPLRAGHSHLLRLERLADGAAVLDRFTDDKTPRWNALRTDPAPEPPRIVVVYAGGAGTMQRMSFDQERVVVGRSADSDVLLNHPDVALRHLELEAQVTTVRRKGVEKTSGEVRVRDLSGRALRINGKRRSGPQGITAQDAIAVGPYTLHVSLFLPDELGPSSED